MCSVTLEKYQDREIKECYNEKEKCPIEDEYLQNIANSFYPDNKDAVIERLVAIYSWGNNDSFIQNMATNFVKLLLKYPECVKKLMYNNECDFAISDTIRSYWWGITCYRCNVDPNDGCVQSPEFVCPNWSPNAECCPGFKKRSQEFTQTVRKTDGSVATILGKAYCCDDGSQVVLG